MEPFWVTLSQGVPLALATLAIGIGFTICLTIQNGSVSTEPGRARLRAVFQGRGWGAAYRGAVNGLLDRFDAAINDDEARKGLDRRHPQRAWTVPLLDTLLVLAIAYPILTVLGQWTVTGAAQSVGGVPILDLQPDVLRRIATMGGLVFSVLLLRFALRDRETGSVTARASSRWRRWTRGIGRVLAFAGAITVTVAVATAVAAAGAVAAVAVTVAVAAAAVAFAGPVAVAVTVAGAFAFAYAGAGAGAGAIAFAVPFAVAGALFLLANVVGRRSGRRGVGRIVLVAGLGVSVFAAIGVLPPVADRDALTVIAFLAVLPLINGVFDFVSVGLTRYSLRRGANGGWPATLAWSAVDLIGGALAFLALGGAVVTAFHFLRDASGGAILDVEIVFAGIRDAPGDYWWLYATFFSTLLPTVLHLGAVCFSIFTWIPPGFHRWARGQLDIAADGDGGQVGAFAAALALIETLCWTLMVVAVWTFLWFVTTHSPDIAWWFYDRFVDYAQLIGALPDDFARRPPG